MPGPNKPDQLFKIVKLIIIAHDALAVIDDPRLLIALEAVKEFFHSISFCKLSESPRLDLISIKPLGAFGGTALIAAVDALCYAALTVLTPLSILTP